MKKVVIVLILVGVAVAAWFLLPGPPEDTPVPPPVIEAPESFDPVTPEPVMEPADEPQAGAEELLPPVPQKPPLPALQESDPAVRESVRDVTAESADTGLLVEDNLLPRIVATVDALTARQVPSKLLPLETPVIPFQANVDIDPPAPVTNAQGDELPQFTLDPVNYDRYEPYVDLLESIDGERFAAEYIRYAPLLQEAYTDLGYPEGDFTTRLLEVIDHLLATPEPAGPVRLVKPEAYYEFVDPGLENLSAGQKVLIRMGPENAARVRDKLVEFRAALGG